MSTIKCPQCNLVNWATQTVCKRCAYRFEFVETTTSPSGFYESSPAQNNSYPAVQTSFQPYGEPVSHQSEFQQSHQDYGHESPPRDHRNNYHRRHSRTSYHPAKRKIKLAVISMVCGIVGFPPLSLFVFGLMAVILGMMLGTAGAMIGFLLAIAVFPTGLVTGIVALRRASKFPFEYGGKGLAITGIVLASLELLLIPLVAAIAIPNLLAARRAANEGSAINAIRVLSEAEARYMSSMSGKCGDIQSLIAGRLLDTSLAKSEKSGYRFEIVESAGGGCEIHATPLVVQGVSATGKRSFFASSSQDWEIRASENEGGRAGGKDRLLEDFSEPRRKIASREP